IDLLRLDRADAADLAFLQYPQQPGLGLQGQLADLVEEQGTAVGGFHQAGTAGDRAGKGALFVSEQLGFDEGFRNRRTRSEEHTSELQSRENLVCRLLLEKKKLK